MEGDELAIRCQSCEAENRVRRTLRAQVVSGESVATSAAQPLLSVVPPDASVPSRDTAVPPGLCPKCLARKVEDQPSCRQCGLVYDNFNPAHFELSESLASLWKETLEDVENEARHRTLLAVAQRSGELPLVARLFRIRMARNPNDLAAHRWSDELIRLVSTTSAGASERETPTPKSQAWVAVLGLIFLTAISWGGFRFLSVLLRR